MTDKDPFEMSNDELLMEFTQLVIDDDHDLLDREGHSRLSDIENVIKLRMREGSNR